MNGDLVTTLTNPTIIFSGLVAIAVFATIYSLILPYFDQGGLEKRMKSVTTEREQIRSEHHEEMTRRAQERGVTLPEEPPAKGQKGKKKGWNDDGTHPGKGQGVGKPKSKPDSKGKSY